MRSQTLPIALASGHSKQLLLETDDQSGRTAVRMDGRPITRPLAPSEEDREFTVESTKFILRRMPNGEFTIDYAPPDLAAGGQWVPPTVKSSSTAGGGKKAKATAGGVGGFIIALVLVRAFSAIGGASSGSAEKLNVSEFQCTKVAFNGLEVSGTVTNTSTAPIALSVIVEVSGGSVLPPKFKGEVSPKPLQPGQAGTFTIRDTFNNPSDANGDFCKLKFTDASGSNVRYKLSGEAARTMERR